MNITYGWAEIVKREKQDDGTMLVTGRMADDGLDRDKQVCDSGWLDKAVPQWFTESANVREMHQPVAAGKAVDYWKADDGGHMITARVVDPVSVTKVDADVLKGFSVGIKNPRVIRDQQAPGGRIVDGTIIEVSLVDRPANPSCTLTVAKADDAGEWADVEQVLVEVEETKVEEPEIVKDDQPQHPVSSAADEVRAQAQKVLDAMSGLARPATDKADAATDIAGAQQAIACIAALIQSEAQGLVNGDMSEAYDIRLLLDAVSSLQYFIDREAAEVVSDADDGVVVVQLADESDTTPEAPEATKADTADTTELEPIPAEGVGSMLTKADLDALQTSWAAKTEEIVQDALAKAEEAHKAEIDTLRADLAKVMAQPIGGGPVRVRVRADQVKADEHDRQSLIAQAEEYEAKADSTNDREVADGYRTLARQQRALATSR